VIDWEYATERGLPVLDGISYVECMQRLASPQTDATGNLIRLADWDWPSSEEIDLLKSLYAHFQIDPELHGTLCRLCWMQHVANQLDTIVRFSPGFMERRVRPMLATLTSA
jgi:hypothetical protein